MAYTKYSLTPANNTATPPDGAPEGMLPSAVNDTMRDMMAQIRDCGDGIRDGTYTMTAAKITGGTITGVTMTSSSVSVTSLTDSGNLTFTGTGNRITGDFSNATPANRVMFQNSATNSNTFIGVIPNGTGTLGVFEAFSSSDPSNSSNIRIRASTTEGRLESSITGTGTYLPLTMYTNGSERLRIDTSGNVGIGNTNPSSYDSVADNLVVGTTSGNNGITIAAGTLGASTINFADATTGTGIYAGYVDYQHNGDYMRFGTNGGTERMRITSGGDVGIGTSSPIAFANKNLEVNGTGDTSFNLSIGGTHTAYFYTTASVTILGSKTNIPLAFNTNNAERMRIRSDGHVGIATTSILLGYGDQKFSCDGTGVFQKSGNTVLAVNRLTNDGTLVAFWQADVQEGDISVSGTTVSYNGGHLSRYAQTTTAKNDSLLKGTVLSNLDEMNEYVRPTTYWTEEDELPEDVNVGDVKKESVVVDNEQLNKVKVSDVEGDVNVAGVFVNWSHDEQHNVDEINMAMTGDMIIRIAQGVVVQKGDLLMSAGDGTAKPQGDDIVRSKTIAKVTSNHVTCTYADGSYCVPCVLMAC